MDKVLPPQQPVAADGALQPLSQKVFVLFPENCLFSHRGQCVNDRA